MTMNSKYVECGIELSGTQSDMLDKLADYMVQYNRNVNLTRITEPDEIVEKHYIDSILPLTMVDVPRGTKVIDVGAGAGFPSLPMKIYRPDLEFTLLDSSNKRIAYLESACELLGLKCETIHARGEDLGRDEKYREKFGIAVARAVAGLNVLCEYCLPFVAVGGSFLALKGEKEETEEAQNAVKTLGGEITEVKKYSLPGGDKRNLVVIKKVSPTPKQYPRVSAKIAKKPL
ncbi:MAG: 16S rRNA (guanine(527)-N(7))-methyltransferase RsmG [Ruminiclostridium sp.]|nr:16S rRNA (guanine(527)-N(7))-methyltransferase RsmG [Ruminiclostridium sp.]